MIDNASLRIGLVGAGMMGSVHARAISQHPRTELALVVDADAERAKSLAETWATISDDTHESAAHLDAVVIASPTPTHRAIATDLIEAGVPLLIEKPMATSYADCTAIADQSERRGIPIMCGLLERYNPAVITAAEIVDDPVYIQAMRHSAYTPRIPTGVADDLAIHDIDLAIRLAQDDVVESRAMFGRHHDQSPEGSEDVADFNLRFSRGAQALVSASRIGQYKLRVVRVFCTDRLIELDLLRQDVTVYRHVQSDVLKDQSFQQQTIVEIPLVRARGEPVVAQLDRFVALVRGSVDADEERRGILPPHLAVSDAALR